MIFVEIHGMNGICSMESLRKEFTHRITSQLRENGVDDPKDILLRFSGNHVTNGEDNASSFCVVHVSPTASTKDLVILVKTLRHESVLGNRIMLSNFGPVPKK